MKRFPRSSFGLIFCVWREGNPIMDIGQNDSASNRADGDNLFQTGGGMKGPVAVVLTAEMLALGFILRDQQVVSQTWVPNAIAIELLAAIGKLRSTGTTPQ